MPRMTRDGGPNITGFVHKLAANNRQVDLFHLSMGELGGESQMGGIIFGHHHASARVLVQPMDYAGPRHAANAAKVAFAMMEQSIHQRVLFVSGRRVND